MACLNSDNAKYSSDNEVHQNRSDESFWWHPWEFQKYNIWTREMTNCKVECHWHALFTLVDMFATEFIVRHIMHFVSMKTRSIWVDVQNGTIMKIRNTAFGDSLHCKLFGTCNLPSNDVMIESLTPKSLKIICFSKPSFKFHSWNQIHDDV